MHEKTRFHSGSGLKPVHEQHLVFKYVVPMVHFVGNGVGGR